VFGTLPDGSGAGTVLPAPPDPYWSDARGALLKEERVAVALVRQLPSALPDDAWIDRDRVTYVCRRDLDARCRDVESVRQQLKEPHARR